MNWRDSFKFALALFLVALIHGRDKRKVRNTIGAAHQMHVIGYTFEMRGDIRLAIAAGLHDTEEDTENALLRFIYKILFYILFGKKVVRLIESVTKNRSLPKEKQKEEMVTRFSNKENPLPLESFILKMADNTHNLESLLAEVKRDGIQIFKNFDGEYEKVMWYYHNMSKAYKDSPYAYDLRYRIEYLDFLLLEIQKDAV